MTKEQLLTPRIKVQFDYPQGIGSHFLKGDILQKNGIHYTRSFNPISLHERDIEKYSELFKPILWWEDRKVEDMPEYVLSIGGCIYKVKIWNKGGISVLDCPGSLEFHNSCVQPATLEEYEEYQLMLKK